MALLWTFKKLPEPLIVTGAVLIGLLPAPLPAAASIEGKPGLELVSTIPLPGVQGRIDHLSVDVKGRRIFVAALGNGTVEVVDTQRGERRSIPGFGEPQGVLYVPASNRLFVANGAAGRVDIVDAAGLSVLRRIEGLADADNVRFAAAARNVIVGYGRGALRFLDPGTGESAGDIALPGHPESF
ncbi:MAG TPA: hypothetical protein VLS49_07160, partial [Usitatibacter sp.]|nr:hypothetical protein [Usitatibacter sp.]